MTKKTKTMMTAVEDGRIVNADLSEIKQDLANLNGHAERGSAFTRKSIERFGSRLAGVLDKANRIIDGNDRQIAYGEADLNEIEIFDADPNKPVYLRFSDLDLSDPENPARELQLALHRSAVESFAIDAENLLVSMNEGLDTSNWFRQDELDALLAGLVQPDPNDWANGMGGLPTEDRAPFQQMTFTLHDTQAEQVKQAIAAASKIGDYADSPNQNSHGNALAFICETFVTDYGQG